MGKSMIQFVEEGLSESQIQQIVNLLEQEREHMLVLSFQDVKNIIQEKRGMVALENKRVVGFVKYFTHGIDKNEVEILECGSLVIDPKLRGRKIGRLLVEKFTKLVRNTKNNSKLIGVVRKSNQVSSRFFRHLGAKEINKPEKLVIYPLGWSEDLFYFFDLTSIKL